ncbi:hybrid sensor histidine kinase/response regulator [Hespellia stercorisuis]|uniref:Stage 0 sporulation protein A homolog n=1 Tax=Hespellia stercorisuis DSM 15480 TaxID=1121950 RepID=A0A1M6LXU9_9FIRM|nr:ATP-binding protein [Hespellia stercorisuis]SHJ76018.1 PAS domain S-box-containing protein [Hespellia stercorisuis DSM 15480]
MKNETGTFENLPDGAGTEAGLEQQRFQMVVDELNAAIIEWDQKGRTFYSSAAYQNYALSKVSADDILNNCGPVDVVHPDDILILQEFFDKSKAGKKKAEVSLRLKMMDGSFHWCRLIGMFYRDAEGEPSRTVGIIIDINEEHQQSVMLSSLLNEIPGGVIIYRIGETIETEYFSDGIPALTGHRVDEYRALINSGNVFQTFVFEEDYLEFEQVVNEAVSARGPINFTYRVKHKDGSLSWLQISACMIREEEGALIYYAVFMKPSDEAALYRNIVENSSNGALVAERRTQRLLFVNEAVGNVLGVPYQRLQKKIEQAEKIAEEYKLLSDEEIRSLRADAFSEFHVVYDGKKHLLINAMALNWNGIDSYILYLTDETAEYEHQVELQSSRVMLDVALSSAKVMAWRYNASLRTITDSGTFGIMYHMPKVIRNITEAFLHTWGKRLIHEDSIEAMDWLFKHSCDGKRIEKDVRCKIPDGSKYVWQRVIYTPIFDKQGVCVEAIGTAVDITEQKEKEQAYEEQLRLNKRMAQDALAIASYNLTKNRIFEAESRHPYYTRIMDCATADEVLEGIRSNVWEGEEYQSFEAVKDCNALLKQFENGTTHVEIRHHLRENTHWMLTSFDMMANPYTGDVEAIGVLWDISEAVRAELVVSRLLKIDYAAISTIDTETGVARPFREKDAPESIRELVNLQKVHEKMEEGMVSFIRKYAMEEDRDRAVTENSLDYVKEQLEQALMYESLFSVKTGNQIIHNRVVYAYLDETKDTILCATQDVTEAYEQEEQKKQELSAALSAAEQANHAKTEFFSRMSHDMRTPMNGILGLTELSEQENDIEMIKENMAKIRESGGYLLSLINDTLDFQRIESGSLKLNNQIVYTNTVFMNILDMIHPAVVEKGIDFQVVNHNAHMGWYVYLDPVRIRQIFINLLSNAIKFTPTGGSVILEVTNLSRNGMISQNCIKVIDTGIGMSKEFLENHLFEPFAQESNDVSGFYAGSGLGLSIAKRLVELMGGRIEVESSLEIGTTFSVYLDFRRVDAGSAQKELDARQSTQFELEEKLVGRKVLLVEDHPLNAQIAGKLLERVGCVVKWENNGAKGVAAFKKSNLNEYDVILMDIRMPEMDGIAAAKTIRGLDREDAGSVPIIAMTANAYDEDVRKSLEAGMNAHLAKPVKPQKMYETIVRFMSEQGGG